ncbi:MAG: type II pantothenate kinase [Clostridia bacterium]|nr:type II pantothenate kinase [Clostridia bacterium]
MTRINIGIDVGGSTTKIVGFRQNSTSVLLTPMFVRATDPMTSLYGAFGKFTSENNLQLSEIGKIMLTGVGSSFVDKPIYSLPCGHVSEFESIGLGGLYISGLREAIVVSMGTGTSIVYAKENRPTEYLGGTGVGGGTLQGLSKLLLGMDNVAHIQELAESGDLSKIDLRVSDISKKGSFPEMKTDLTAANFGKVSDIAEKQDVAAGIFNIVFETIAMVSIFAARFKGTKDIVLTGNMASFPLCRSMFESFSHSFGMNFLIPEYARFATVIGAALQA